jgi:hypothetical protein
MLDDAPPKIDGIPLKLTRLEGPGGPFKIGFAGIRKESDSGYFYQDDRGGFGFYAESRDKPATGWDVNYASRGAWSGAPFKTTPENEAVFRQNIEFFFKTRDWLNPEQPGDESTLGVPVTFSWKIAQ